MKFTNSFFQLLGLACAGSLLFFALNYASGINLWDEGHLWYGVQRTALGEFPVLDFMSYDPGRYYWSALFIKIFRNSSIVICRAAASVFEVFAILVGLRLIWNSSNSTIKLRNFLFLNVATLILALWMYVWYKIFDSACSIFVIGTLKFLLESPSKNRFFISGIFLGLIAVFGRNHGIYGIFGLMLILAFMFYQATNKKELLKNTFYFLPGLIVGFSPLFVMIGLIPGFGKAFWESIISVFKFKSTNFPLNIPWPWAVDFSSRPFRYAIPDLLVGIFFVFILIFAFVSLIWLIFRKVKNKNIDCVILACAAVAIPYAHYAFSRADLFHLSLGVFPFLIGTLAFSYHYLGRLKWPVCLVLFITTARLMFFAHPGYTCWRSSKCEMVTIAGSHLKVTLEQKNSLLWLTDLKNRFAPNEENVLILPYWPGVYSVIEKRSPIWEIYALWPRDKEFELQEIEKIKSARPAVVVFLDFAVDGKEELHFKNTHPLTYQYIKNNFDVVPEYSDPSIQVMKPKSEQKVILN